MQFRVKLLSSTALAAVAALAATSVSAQDVGALEKRVQALEKSGAGQYVSRSKKTMNLVVSGHINEIMQLRDNGEASAFTFTGNNESQTRFRLVGTGKLSNDVSVRTVLELGEGSSSTQTIDSNALTDDQATMNVRQMYIALSSKSLGTLRFGDSSLATDGYHGRADMSGTTLVQTAGLSILPGGEPFKNAAGANSGVTRGIFNNLDAGRTDNIAYFSPQFAGFQFVTSYANEDNQNYGLNYGGDFGGVKVKGAIAYDITRAATDVKTTNGSIGVLLPMGLNAMLGAASEDRDTGGAERDRIFAKIGYQFTASELGQTRLALAWGENESGNATNDEGEHWSLGLVQVIEPLGAEVYAAYHNLSAERTGVDIQDIDVVTVGMRVSF